MKVKGKYSESAKLYIIFLIVGLAAAIAVFFIVLNLTAKPAEQTEKPAETTAQTEEAEPEDEGYSVSAELSEEMKDAATTLLSNNYSILKYYYIKGMKHLEEPYGNVPEDGYYTVDSSKFSTLSELEKLVDSTFVKEFAEDVKNDSLGYGPIYKTRDDGTLGIIANFTPMDYDRSWENPVFKISPISDDDCLINVTIHEKSDGSDVKITAEMKKTDKGWRLTSIVY